MIILSKLTKRFKIVMDECWKVERPEVRNEARQWYEQIPCRGGAFIGLYSETPPILQLSTPRAQNAKKIWQQIKNKPGCRADFHFDGEAILFFPPEQLDVVAEGAGARVKRQGRLMTPEQKAKLAEMGREALKKLRDATPQTQESPQGEAISTQARDRLRSPGKKLPRSAQPSLFNEANSLNEA